MNNQEVNENKRLAIRHMAKCLTDLDSIDTATAIKSVVKLHFNNLANDLEQDKARVSVEQNYNR